MPREGFWRSAFAAAGLFLAASGPCAQPAPEPATEVVPKQLVTARGFMVVAAHPLAARAGYDAIRRGGSAVDAAIAKQLVVNLVEPQSSGVGGGGVFVFSTRREARRPGAARRENPPPRTDARQFL